MNPHYNQHYTKEQIVLILQTIQDCVRENRFVISKNENRQENIGFINHYNLTSKMQKEILLQIKFDDFCHTLQNTNIGYEYETLYVFYPQVTLFNLDVISFHERNKPIDYLFR